MGIVSRNAQRAGLCLLAATRSVRACQKRLKSITRRDAREADTQATLGRDRVRIFAISGIELLTQRVSFYSLIIDRDFLRSGAVGLSRFV
jgi:hypothetical protein